MKRLLFAAAALVLVARTATAQGPIAPELSKISPEFAAAFTAKDAVKLATFYTDDAVLLPPGAPMVKGKAEIQKYFQQGFTQGLAGLKLQPVEATVAGLQGFEAGTSVVTIAAGPNTLTSRGKYIVVYKRVGGVWKIAYDMFNDDQPAGAPPKP